MVKNKIFFMKEALKEAQKAYDKDEVPVGAVIVCNNKIVARGYNLKETKKDATLHAEIIAIKKASKKMKFWRLSNCEMYVTLEPCAMCAGAIISSRIKKIFFGAYDKKLGSVVSKAKLLEKGIFNHNMDFEGGLLEIESQELLQSFFREKRKFDN